MPSPAVDSISTVAPTSAARSCIPSKPEAAVGRIAALGIEADAIVFDDEQHRIRLTLEYDVDARCARVLGDVGERLLRDAIERRLGFRWQPIVEQPGHVQLCRNVDTPRPVLDVVGECRAQAEVVERGRPQLPDELIDVTIELPRDFLQRLDERPDIRRACGRFLQGADAAAQSRQLFAELIVHLARDPPPFVFLREDEAGEELGACPLGFRLPPFRQVEVRADDAHDRSARFAAHRISARQDLDVVTVLVQQAELAFVGERAATDAVVELLRARHVLGMQQPFPGADVRLDLVLGVAEHLLPARRIDDVARQQVPVPDAFLRSGERERQALLAFAQGGLGALALGDLPHREHDGRRLTIEQRQARHSDLDVTGATVGLVQLLFEGCDVLAGGGAGETLRAYRAARGLRSGQRSRVEAVRSMRVHWRRRTAWRPRRWQNVMTLSWAMSMPSGDCSIRIR